jgi:hypothetical protein
MKFPAGRRPIPKISFLVPRIHFVSSGVSDKIIEIKEIGKILPQAMRTALRKKIPT